MVALPAACGCREDHVAYLCFTPASASLVVGNSLQVTATLQPEDEPSDRACIEKENWQWVSWSNDGGEIEFSQIELDWSGPAEGIYVAQVLCTARQAGTVSIRPKQAGSEPCLGFTGGLSCIDVCTITVTTSPFIW